MSAKQDRVAPRTAEDVERRNNYGKSYSEVMGIATDARKTAKQAYDEARQCHSEIIELADSITLTVTGGSAGDTASIVLKVGDQEYSGQINLAGLVTFESLKTSGTTQIDGGNMVTGEIKSSDGSVVIDLDGNMITINRSDGTYRTKFSSGGVSGFGLNQNTNQFERTLSVRPGRVCKNGLSELTAISSYQVALSLDGPMIYIGNKLVSWKDNGDGTFTMIGR